MVVEEVRRVEEEVSVIVGEGDTRSGNGDGDEDG